MRTARSAATTLASLALLAIAGCTATTTTEPAPPSAPPAPPSVDVWEAAGSGNLEALAAHADAGANLDGLHAELGITPLVAATVGRQHDAVGWLLENEADVNARTGDGGSALIAAAFLGEAKVAKMLLDAGADAGIRNDNGQTVWDLAALDWQTTKAFADFLNLPLEREALEAGRAEILALLEPQLADLAQDDVWTAMYVGDIDAVRRHMEGDLDIDARDPDGTTLLTIASLLGHYELARLLIDAGADVNKTNYQDGSTPLHAAAFLGRADVVALLLDHGAEPDAMSDDGGTPLGAAELGWEDTATLAGILQIEVDEATMRPGKVKAAELLRTAAAQ